MSLVVGDIHGSYNLLMKILDILPHDDLVFTGDLIDRGLDSCKVVEFVKSNDYKCVLGNHEDLMLTTIELSGDTWKYERKLVKGYIAETWDYNGAKATFDSYNNDFELMNEHYEWMKTLPLLHWVDDKTVVSHSYYLPYIGKENDPMFKDSVTWDRYSRHASNGILNIHGHSIVDDVLISNNYVNVDTGAFRNNTLSAFDTETKKVYQVKE